MPIVSVRLSISEEGSSRTCPSGSWWSGTACTPAPSHGGDDDDCDGDDVYEQL